MRFDYPHMQKSLDSITHISADRERVLSRLGRCSWAGDKQRIRMLTPGWLFWQPRISPRPGQPIPRGQCHAAPRRPRRLPALQR
jgi:hypothetical protein